MAVASAAALGAWTIAHTVEPARSPGDAVAVDVGLTGPGGAPLPGDQLLPLSLGRLDGSPLDLPTGGTPVWIRFWAAGCSPCGDEAAGLADGLGPLLLKTEARLVDVVLGAPLTDGRGGLSGAVAGVAAAIDGDGATARALGVSTLPAHVLIGRDGAITATRGSRLTVDQVVALLRLVEAPR